MEEGVKSWSRGSSAISSFSSDSALLLITGFKTGFLASGMILTSCGWLFTCPSFVAFSPDSFLETVLLSCFTANFVSVVPACLRGLGSSFRVSCLPLLEEEAVELPCVEADGFVSDFEAGFVSVLPLDPFVFEEAETGLVLLIFFLRSAPSYRYKNSGYSWKEWAPNGICSHNPSGFWPLPENRTYTNQGFVKSVRFCFPYLP